MELTFLPPSLRMPISPSPRQRYVGLDLSRPIAAAGAHTQYGKVLNASVTAHATRAGKFEASVTSFDHVSSDPSREIAVDESQNMYGKVKS